MTDLNVPLGPLQERDGSGRILVCDRCVSSQGKLLTLAEVHRVEVLIGHGRVEMTKISFITLCWKTEGRSVVGFDREKTQKGTSEAREKVRLVRAPWAPMRDISSRFIFTNVLYSSRLDLCYLLIVIALLPTLKLKLGFELFISFHFLFAHHISLPLNQPHNFTNHIVSVEPGLTDLLG